MGSKVNSLICIFLFVFINNSIAQKNNNLLDFKIADKISTNEKKEPIINDMNFAFFDEDINKIYFSLPKEIINVSDTNKSLRIEIKKKSIQQTILKPLIIHSITNKNSSSLSTIYIDSIDISNGIASGNFDLLLVLNNHQQKEIVAKKTFQTIRKKNTPLILEIDSSRLDEKEVESSFVKNYSIEQLQKYILALQPIATEIEAKPIANMSKEKDIKLVRQYFYNFWYNRNALQPEKEWKEYAEKLNYVAKKYGVTGFPGYETDRGRIYLIFGEPDKIDRRPNEKGAYPYEVWFYNYVRERRNVTFLFFQPGLMAEEMKLLHSTEPDIIKNPYWKSVLLKDPNNKDNKLMYRVFEYFK